MPQDRFMLRTKDVLHTKAAALLVCKENANKVVKSGFDMEKRRIIGANINQTVGNKTVERYKKARNKEIHFDRPEAILDAPGLRDDFYLNLLDWNSRNGLSIALNNAVYLYDYEKQQTHCVTSTQQPDSYVTSLHSFHEGTTLAVSNNLGCISMVKIDENLKTSRIFTLPAPVRIPAMAASGSTLWTGCGTGELCMFDGKSRKRLPTEIIGNGHTKEVCGLGMASEGEPYMASGGNDNRVCIWDIRMMMTPLHVQDDHAAAVKAIAWCPWQRHLLATGSGTADRRIRFWNAVSGACLRTIESDSQVCALLWAKNQQEIISAHGYSTNELSIWQYPSLVKVASRPNAHETRILHAAISPDGTAVATTAANDCIKFWRAYPSRPLLRKPTIHRLR